MLFCTCVVIDHLLGCDASASRDQRSSPQRISN